MKIRRLIGVLSATVALAAPTLFVAGTAGAAPGGSVQRYQMETLTFNVALTTGRVWTHTFTAQLNPCNGMFSGTGGNTTPNNQRYETITGTYFGGNLSYTATQYYGTTPDSLPQGTWSTDSPVSISGGVGKGTASSTDFGFGSSLIQVTGLSEAPITSYVNHGAFVSQNPGAASGMSCLGRPIQSMP